MKKAKEHASELVVAYSDAIMNKHWKTFTEKLADVFNEVAISEVKELQKARNIKLDSGLVPIFKDQRQKYGSICRIVNSVKADLLSIADFDGVIKEIYPNIYNWYVSEIL